MFTSVFDGGMSMMGTDIDTTKTGEFISRMLALRGASTTLTVEYNSAIE